MTCSRCGGHLVLEQSIEFYQPQSRWRCVNCGARKDPVPSPSSKSLELSPRGDPRRGMHAQQTIGSAPPFPEDTQY